MHVTKGTEKNYTVCTAMQQPEENRKLSNDIIFLFHITYVVKHYRNTECQRKFMLFKAVLHTY